MIINTLSIKNFKTIENIKISPNSFTCFIGINNSGKTSILKALYHFYLNLKGDYLDPNCFNQKNRYIQTLEIEVSYDVTSLIRKGFVENQDTTEQQRRLMEYLTKNATKEGTNDIIYLKMIQHRDGTVIWDNMDKEIRKNLADLFPVFYIDTRMINLYNWDSLWTVVSTLAPKKMYYNIESSAGQSLIEKNLLDIINNALKINGIIIEDPEPFEKISTYVQHRLGGKNFDNEENNLKLSSYGINMFTYLKVFLHLIDELCRLNPIVIPIMLLDEPEINLHPKNIERLASVLIGKKFANGSCLISTHSSILIRTLLKKSEIKAYHVSYNWEKKKSIISKFRSVPTRDNYLISDKESNIFLSEASLFVEGNTELELFTNENIRSLYRTLEYYDVYNFNSDYKRLRIVNPYDNNSKVKHHVLLDMDKILNFRKNKFIVNKSETYINPLINPEVSNNRKLLHTGKHYKLKYLEKRIFGITKGSEFITEGKYKIAIDDELYRELLNLIKGFCKMYNIYPVETTIEGTLINKNNYKIFLKWLENQCQMKEIRLFLSNCTSKYQKVAFLRILFGGKTDNLATQKPGNWKFDNSTLAAIRFNACKKKKFIFDKQSGWVTDFIDWYFSKYIESDKEVGYNRKVFIKHFPELGEILKLL